MPKLTNVDFHHVRNFAIQKNNKILMHFLLQNVALICTAFII